MRHIAPADHGGRCWGAQKFNSLYGREPNLSQAGVLITLVLTVMLLYLAQRVFMLGAVFSGVEK